MSELESLRGKMASGVFLLIFGAKWAPPSIILNRLVVRALPQGVEYLFLDSESDSSYADYFNVVTIPTVITSVNGRELDRKTGAVSDAEIVSMARVALNYSNRT